MPAWWGQTTNQPTNRTSIALVFVPLAGNSDNNVCMHIVVIDRVSNTPTCYALLIGTSGAHDHYLLAHLTNTVPLSFHYVWSSRVLIAEQFEMAKCCWSYAIRLDRNKTIVMKTRVNNGKCCVCLWKYPLTKGLIKLKLLSRLCGSSGVQHIL